MERITLWGLCGLLILGLAGGAHAAPSSKRVSVSSSGAQGNGASQFSDITPNGEFIAFQSSASNLVSGDTCCSDIFRRRRASASSIIRVSVGPGNRAANNFSQSPVISDNGNLIAFSSQATNLVDADGNGITGDIFVREISAGITTLVSVNSSGIQANASSFGPAISGNGRFVAFKSDATNLVSNDTNQARDIFVRDLVNGATQRVSLTSSGGQASGASGAGSTNNDIAISSNGSRIVFWSTVRLTSDDTDSGADLYMRDTGANTTRLVSFPTRRQEAAGNAVDISNNGRYVAFSSLLGIGDSRFDVYLRDLQTGNVTRASVDSAGTAGDKGSGFSDLALAPDGSAVAFQSDATNLVTGDSNGLADIFVRKFASGTTRRISVSTSGTKANKASHAPAISNNSGRYTTFFTQASNLVSGDTNNFDDVFVRGQ